VDDPRKDRGGRKIHHAGDGFCADIGQVHQQDDCCLGSALFVPTSRNRVSRSSCVRREPIAPM
jgi:hypothetical protein